MGGYGDKYWLNGIGYKDPTLAKVIEQENISEKARNKQVHDTIGEIKNILRSRDMELLGRLEIRDKLNKQEYR